MEQTGQYPPPSYFILHVGRHIATHTSLDCGPVVLTTATPETRIREM